MKALSILALTLFVSTHSFANDQAAAAAQPANAGAAAASAAATEKAAVEQKAEKPVAKAKKKHKK